jgi:Ca2+/H+ antiporter
VDQDRWGSNGGSGCSTSPGRHCVCVVPVVGQSVWCGRHIPRLFPTRGDVVVMMVMVMLSEIGTRAGGPRIR